MKKFITLSFILMLLSCSETIEKPKNLIPEDTMANLIADIALNEQLGTLNSKGDMDTSTKYILKKYNVTSKDFSDSHAYYLSTYNKMEDIYNKAQEILKNKAPSLKPEIDKAIKKNE